MRVAALAALAAAACVAAPACADVDDSALHALIIAGSSGFGNYRHQSDAAHAYHTLRAHGVPADNVILMSYDDAATSRWNPAPGKLYNAPPPSPDVRAGAPVDYSGDDVNAQTFLAVLLGDAAGAARLAPNSTRRVVTSDAASRLFVFYVDHGAPGLLGMPAGPPLFAPDLAAALGNMTARRDAALARTNPLARLARRWLGPRRVARAPAATAPGTATFAEAVVFVEACESGSMFDGFLPALPPPRRDDGDDIDAASSSSPWRRALQPSHIGAGVFALTAANGHESSWGTYCPSPDAPDPALDAFQTCLGDLFAVTWMEEADAMLAAGAGARLAHERLRSLFAHVRAATARNGTYAQGSHVHGYGDARLEREEVDAFLGAPDAAPAARVARTSDGAPTSPRHRHHTTLLPAADADALHARLAAARGDAGAAADLAARAAAAAAADAVVAAVAPRAVAARPPGAPAVDDWGCLKAAVAAWDSACGTRVSQHVTRVGRALAAACNAGAGAGAVVAAVTAACDGGHGVA